MVKNLFEIGLVRLGRRFFKHLLDCRATNLTPFDITNKKKEFLKTICLTLILINLLAFLVI